MRPILNTKSFKQIPYFLFLLFGLLYLRSFFEIDSLPDYASYKNIYENPDNFKNWNIAFTTLASMSSRIISFDVFRLLIFLCGVAVYYQVFKLASRSSFILIISAVCIVLLEFFMIRIRGGVSIFLFYVGLYHIRKSSISLSIIFFSLSGLFHIATFVTIFLIYWPQILRVRLNVPFLLLNLAIWLSFLLLVDYISLGRGAHLYSSINPARIFLLMICPVFLLLVLSQMKFAKIKISHNAEFFGLLVLTSALLLLFFVGVFVTSGEAIVRIYSVVAGPVLLRGLIENYDHWPGSYRNYALVVLACNSLFFINTVYI